MQNRNEIIQESFAIKNYIDRGNLKANAKTQLQYLARRSLRKGEFELIAQVIPNTARRFYLMATLNNGFQWEAVGNSEFSNLIEFFVNYLNKKHPVETLANFSEQKGIEIGDELRGILAALFIPGDKDT